MYSTIFKKESRIGGKELRYQIAAGMPSEYFMNRDIYKWCNIGGLIDVIIALGTMYSIVG